MPCVWRHCHSCQQQICAESCAAALRQQERTAQPFLYPSWKKNSSGGLWGSFTQITSPTCGNHEVSSTYRGAARSRSYKLSPKCNACAGDTRALLFSVRNGGTSARRLRGHRDPACENGSGGWEHVCAGSEQPRLACALRGFRMQRRGADCRGTGGEHRCSGAAVWVLLGFLFPFLMHNLETIIQYVGFLIKRRHYRWIVSKSEYLIHSWGILGFMTD